MVQSTVTCVCVTTSPLVAETMVIEPETSLANAPAAELALAAVPEIEPWAVTVPDAEDVLTAVPAASQTVTMAMAGGIAWGRR